MCRVVKKPPRFSLIRTGSAPVTPELTRLHLCETDSHLQRNISRLVFNRGATGRGQIHDYFSRRRVFKGPLKEKLEYKGRSDALIDCCQERNGTVFIIR